MPTSGPTAEVVRAQSDGRGDDNLPYTLVDLDVATASQASLRQNAGINELEAIAPEPASERADMIRPGDTLAIEVFEVGVSLFSGVSTPAALAVDPTRTPTASTQTFKVQVREDGTIDLPYVGTIKVRDSYPEVLAAYIQKRLRGLSEHPAVTVNIIDSLRNVVYVGGAVSRAGRYRLTAAHERLLDVLALAGGSPVDVNDLQVTLVRGGHPIAVPLNQIQPDGPADVPLMPGDRIMLERVQQSYTVFGATDKVSQVPFEARKVSLAEALARVGGPSDWRANPRGVYLFRLEKDSAGKPRPTVYHINMLKPESYFVAQMFAMRDKDVILFANSKASLTQKLFSMFSQLFNPFVAVKTATQ